MKLSRGERTFEGINYVTLTVLTLFFLIPFLSVVATSLTSASEWARRGEFILIPYRPVLSAYRMLLGQGSVVRNAFLVTFARVAVGTFLNLLLTFPLAYVLSKRRLPGRVAITWIIFFTMLFSGGLVPNFVLVERLGLLNSFWSMILPGLVNPWWMLIMRNFIMGTIPDELEEAALVDGATAPQILLRIILPLSLPIIATMGLWYAVAHWNAWFDAVIYINDPWKWPIQPILRSLLQRGLGTYSQYEGLAALELEEPPPAKSIQAAMIIIVTAPILFVYPWIQRYFIKGVMVGGVKG